MADFKDFFLLLSFWKKKRLTISFQKENEIKLKCGATEEND